MAQNADEFFLVTRVCFVKYCLRIWSGESIYQPGILVATTVAACLSVVLLLLVELDGRGIGGSDFVASTVPDI